MFRTLLTGDCDGSILILCYNKFAFLLLLPEFDQHLTLRLPVHLTCLQRYLRIYYFLCQVRVYSLSSVSESLRSICHLCCRHWVDVTKHRPTVYLAIYTKQGMYSHLGISPSTYITYHGVKVNINSQAKTVNPRNCLGSVVSQNVQAVMCI